MHRLLSCSGWFDSFLWCIGFNSQREQIKVLWVGMKEGTDALLLLFALFLYVHKGSILELFDCQSEMEKHTARNENRMRAIIIYAAPPLQSSLFRGAFLVQLMSTKSPPGIFIWFPWDRKRDRKTKNLFDFQPQPSWEGNIKTYLDSERIHSISSRNGTVLVSTMRY